MATVYVVQHGEKERSGGDAGLTARQAALAARGDRRCLLRSAAAGSGDGRSGGGVPSGAVTTIRGLEVVEIASVRHLGGA